MGSDQSLGGLLVEDISSQISSGLWRLASTEEVEPAGKLRLKRLVGRYLDSLMVFIQGGTRTAHTLTKSHNTVLKSPEQPNL